MLSSPTFIKSQNPHTSNPLVLHPCERWIAIVCKRTDMTLSFLLSLFPSEIIWTGQATMC